MIDDQGRVFGKLNIIDAAVVLLIGLLIPLAYGAYAIFRPEAPRLTAVDPPRVPAGTTEVRLQGENLRAYLRVNIDQTAVEFLFLNAGSGVIRFPPLKPGTYDVVLHDEAQEIHRLPGGLVVETPRATGSLFAVGAFFSLEKDAAQSLWQALRDSIGKPAAWGEVVGVLPPEPNRQYLAPPADVAIMSDRYQVQAVLRLACVLQQSDCFAQNVKLLPSSTLSLEVGGRSATFRADELHPPYNSTVDVLVRSDVTPREIDALRAALNSTSETFPARAALRASLLSLEVAGTNIAMIRMRVPAMEAPNSTNGWVHRNTELRIGENFGFPGPSYIIRGRVVAVRRVSGEPEAR